MTVAEMQKVTDYLARYTHLSLTIHPSQALQSMYQRKDRPDADGDQQHCAEKAVQQFQAHPANIQRIFPAHRTGQYKFNGYD